MFYVGTLYTTYKILRNHKSCDGSLFTKKANASEIFYGTPVEKHCFKSYLLENIFRILPIQMKGTALTLSTHGLSLGQKR